MSAPGGDKKPMLKKFDLSGKVALVTGASRGIGAGMALALAEAGADMALVARTEDALESTATRVRALGRKALVVPTDVSKVDSLSGMVERIVAEYGHLDILVNAAGVQCRKPILEVTEADWDFVNSVNLKGLYFVSQAVARQMLKQGKGKIVNICSLTTSIGIANVSIYSATKGAVLSLTRTQSREWSRQGITVNAIGPGYFNTEMTKRLYDDPAMHQWIVDRTPMGRWGEVDDLMGAVVFLSSDASDFISGVLLNVDGGWLSA
ncbi:MAG TPA: SDR family oxidoreductase [Chloroflexota bacterium]|nr:SDR family oxidoreductase [Chloroflexota bacterium]